MSDIYDQAEEYKRALLKRERAAAVRLVNAYGLAWSRISRQLKAITRQIREAREKGEIVSQSWLYRQERYIKLLDQVSRELVRFAEVAEVTITKEQRAAVKAGLRDSQALMGAAVSDAGISASFNRVNFSAVETLVGFLGNGSPLNTLLGELPRKGRAIVEKGLIDGVTLGHGPKKIAREIRAGLAGNLNRALLISRTEVTRTYREATRQTYQANSDLGGQWQWVASKSLRTCAACIALDGQRFPLSKPLPAHPACRCTSLFVLDDFPPPARETGAEWFAKQPADAQRAILGSDRAYQAFKDGQATLQDFVGRKDSMLWGQSYYRLSAKRAIAGEGRFPASVQAARK